ncbi:MAG: phosphate-starvation-inducible PsiE family protein [Acidimicrobiales bacterium]
MDEQPAMGGGPNVRTDAVVTWAIVVIEYAIVVSLLLVAGVVLVRTVVGFLHHWSTFPDSVVAAIDGILVVIILLDIVNTVFRNLRSSEFPVRPFLVIGVLAGIREILSSSARLTLSSHLKTSSFHDTVITLGIGVGVVFFLLVGLLILGLAERREER